MVLKKANFGIYRMNGMMELYQPKGKLDTKNCWQSVLVNSLGL